MLLLLGGGVIPQPVERAVPAAALRVASLRIEEWRLVERPCGVPVTLFEQDGEQRPVFALGSVRSGRASDRRP
jgi:hypothetical protein